MRPQEEITVPTVYGDTKFTIQAMDGNSGYRLAVKVAKWLSAGLSKGTFDATNAMGWLAVLHEIPEEEFDKVRKDVLKGALAEVDGEFQDVTEGFTNLAFAGHPGGLIKLVFAATKLTVGNFLKDLGVQGLAPKSTTPETKQPKAGMKLPRG